MKHPIQKYNDQQEKLLETLPPDERPKQKLMFSIGNAAYCYHNQVIQTIEPTEEDFEDWVSGLPENIGKDMRAKGFEACKAAFPFTRHVLERRDIGMDQWMKEHLTQEEYEWWQSQRPGENS